MFTALKIFRKEKKSHQQGLVKLPFRYFLRWRNSLLNGASSVKDEQPWITFQAMDFLSKNLASTDKVIEYGGGGSTLFFLKKVSEVITIEHNKEWFDLLKDIVSKKNNSSWKGNFIPAEKNDLFESPDPSNPKHYSSDDLPSKHFNYKKYASAIDSFPDNYFACVLVDGRSRPSCVMHAIPKIKKGGWLVLDNSDREYYFPGINPMLSGSFELVFDTFGPSPYSRAFTKTTIWKKIK